MTVHYLIKTDLCMLNFSIKQLEDWMFFIFIIDQSIIGKFTLIRGSLKQMVTMVTWGQPDKKSKHTLVHLNWANAQNGRVKMNFVW